MAYHSVAAHARGDVAPGLRFTHRLDSLSLVVRNADRKSQHVDRRFLQEGLMQLRSFSPP
jgi:hypothetical protein